MMSAPLVTKCLICRQRAVSPTTLASYETEIEHDGRKYAISVADFQVLQCQNCGEIYLDVAADERLSDALRRAAGLLRPDEIREGREGLNLTQKQLANLLRIPEFTLSRLESGAQIQQTSIDALLRVFFRSAEARDILGDPDGEASGIIVNEQVSHGGLNLQPQG